MQMNSGIRNILSMSFALTVTSPAVDIILGHFEYQIDYDPSSGWFTSISYDLDGSFADDVGVIRIDNSEVRLLAAPSTLNITATPPPEFGEPNARRWILSQNNVPGELFFGWRAIYERGLFQANVNGNFSPSPLGSISSDLVDVTGTGVERDGRFAMWTSGGFNRLEFHYNSNDGIDETDILNPIPAGSHSHYNWGFTQPGTYDVTFENSGRLNPQFGGEDVSSRATLSFVIPHDGFMHGTAHWRLGDGQDEAPLASVYDAINQVDYSPNQVSLIATDGVFSMNMVTPDQPSIGQVGIAGVDNITFAGDNPVTVTLINHTGPGSVAVNEAEGATLFNFDADGIHRVTLQATQGEITGEPFTLTFLSNLNVDYTYEDWADSFERAHQLAPGALADSQADHDGDQVINALEFLLFWHGFDPVTQDASLLPSPRFVDGHAEITFLRDHYKDDFSSTPMELSAAYSPDHQTPWRPWRRLVSEGAPDQFYEDGAELGNETSPVMRRRLVVPDASPHLGFFRFEQSSRN